MIIPTPKRPTINRHSQEESKIQISCIVWFHNTYPEYRGLLFHCPNENSRSDSNAMQGAIRKSLGLVAGVSDIIFLLRKHQYGALLIEMKTPTGHQSEAQKQWQKLVESNGYKYVVVRSLEDFQKEIKSYVNG